MPQLRADDLLPAERDELALLVEGFAAVHARMVGLVADADLVRSQLAESESVLVGLRARERALRESVSARVGGDVELVLPRVGAG